MKAIAAVSPGKVECIDIPAPTIREYECLVKVTASGFCNATDTKIIEDHLSNMRVDFPAIIGHESVGEVVEVGSKVRSVELGDCFTNPVGRLEPGTPFNRMWACMVEYAVVQDHAAMDELGIDASERIGWGVCPIPREMPPEDAAVLLGLKESLSAVRNFGCRPGNAALVYGDGPMGLALVQFLRVEGAGWIGCVGHHDERLQKAVDVGGADLTVNSRTEDVRERVGEQRLDLVIDAVGSTAILSEASKMVKPGGKVGLTGVLSPDSAEMSLLDLANHTCLHILSFPFREHALHDEIVDMAMDGRINAKDYYSHVVPYENVERAIELVRNREAFKVVLKP